jgi:signal transduction histidine kinase
VVLSEIFQNLLSNAIKYTQRGQIEVGAGVLDNGFVQCWVKDTGSGIPEDRIGKVFDKFETDPDKDGSGLGLAIVKQAVEAHGGHISVESQRRALLASLPNHEACRVRW